MTQPPPKTDGQLLAQFCADHSQAAFAELVNRHGAMVHGVALRVLADHHEAQDVMQAVFLVLARKAAALRRSESVGGWLHTVAWRLALNAQQSRRSRQQREATAMRDQPTVTAAAQPEAGLFRAELDAALSDLPERYRQPVVLFHLEAKSLEETAQRLGLNIKTAGTRLTRARELLRKKLVRRGVTVGSVGALTALLSAESGAATLPATIVAATVKVATGGAVSTTVAALSKAALHMLFIAKVKTVSLAAAACLVVAGTGAVVAQQAAKPSQPVTASDTAASFQQISELVDLSTRRDLLSLRWIGKTRPEDLRTFRTINPPLLWTIRSNAAAGGNPGDFDIEGSNWEERNGSGIWRFNVRVWNGNLWLAAIYGTQSSNAWVEYIQTTNSAHFIRSAWRDGKFELDPAQRVDFTATNLAGLQAQMSDKLRGYWAPTLALLTTQDLLGPAGDSFTVFKPIDATQPGFYANGKWSYALEIKGDQRQGFLKYDAKNVGDPQPGDYILTPWGWMQWQNGTWLPVAEKPAKGRQLPDPAVDPSIVSRPPPSP